MTRDLLFNGWPYLAFAIFAAGLLVLFVRHGLRTGPSDDGAMRLCPAAPLWRISLMLLALAHAGGLLFPEVILRWNLKPGRLYILEGTAAVVGVIVLCAWILAAWRYFAASGGTIVQQIADVIFLACFFLETISGLLTAIFYRWASSWAPATLTPYIRSLVKGQPESAFLNGLPFVVQLHLLPAFVMLAILPVTTTGFRMAGATIRSFKLFISPVSRWVEYACAFWRDRSQLSIWLWPEEEE